MDTNNHNITDQNNEITQNFKNSISKQGYMTYFLQKIKTLSKQVY